MNYQGIDYKQVFENKFPNVTYDNHSMGSSLRQYIEIKLLNDIFNENISEINIIGKYIRSYGISPLEKNNKEFNYKRPTINIIGDKAYIYCFPGVDYVYHYACLVKTYLNIIGKEKTVNTFYPTSQEIKQCLLVKSGLEDVPKCKTMILGYVQGFDYLSDNSYWIGSGDFLWKYIDKNKILLGCKHSYWGDIAGHVVDLLAKNGTEKVIYVGKLGTLNENYIPNECLATGNKSIFMDGSFIEWYNIFNDIDFKSVKHGIHATLPSVIQETKEWVLSNKNKVDFVDPEIGHMAKAAVDDNIMFSYLHIISDNLSRKFEEDLSNERKEEILIKRKKLIKEIGNRLIEL